MRQVAGRATTARAPHSLRAKAAEERSRERKRRSSSSRSPRHRRGIACAGAILITTAGEGLGERPEPILSSRTTEQDADSAGQSQSQQNDSQANSAPTDSSSTTPDQSQGTDSSSNSGGTQSGTTDSSQTTDGSQQSTGDQTSGNASARLNRQQQHKQLERNRIRHASDSSSQGTTSATKHDRLSQITDLYNGREPATVAPFALGAEVASPARW